MNVDHTGDLALFMDKLKAWSIEHRYVALEQSLDEAEKKSATASDLIRNYVEILRDMKTQIPYELPNHLRECWNKAIVVGDQALETVVYPKKKRSLFSFAWSE